jgi:nicotinamidase-related amidase
MYIEKYLVTRVNTILVVIDVQEKFVTHINDYGTVGKNIGILIKGAKRLGIPILVTEQYPKGLGRTAEDLAELIEKFNPIEKDMFSCFREPKFKDVLKKAVKSHIVITGIESHVCVLQTVLDLIKDGYSVVVVSDAVGSRSKENKDTALTLMREAGAVITSTESIIFQWLEKSGTPEFKEVQALVK